VSHNVETKWTVSARVPEICCPGLLKKIRRNDETNHAKDHDHHEADGDHAGCPKTDGKTAHKLSLQAVDDL